MIDLTRKLKDELIISDKRYPLNLSFDNVLRLLEMWQDGDIESYIKPYLALGMLTGESFKDYSVEDVVEISEAIFEEHIKIKTPVDYVVEYDLMGNIIPKLDRKKDDEDEEDEIYNIKYDSDYIFSSFFQAYNIDLIEEQGKLHWQKFNALLNGLPKNTKFREVLEIRSWKPSKGDSSEYKSAMRKLQEVYKLP